jgi:hypothetical protein
MLIRAHGASARRRKRLRRLLHPLTYRLDQGSFHPTLRVRAPATGTGRAGVGLKGAAPLPPLPPTRPRPSTGNVIGDVGDVRASTASPPPPRPPPLPRPAPNDGGKVKVLGEGPSKLVTIEWLLGGCRGGAKAADAEAAKPENGSMVGAVCSSLKCR